MFGVELHPLEDVEVLSFDAYDGVFISREGLFRWSGEDVVIRVSGLNQG